MIKYVNHHSAEILLTVCLMIVSQASQADPDCDWNMQQLDRYNQMCSSNDGCVSRERMKSIVDQSCGIQGNQKTANAASSNNDDEGPKSTMTYSSSSSASNAKPEDKEDYTGEPCVYFTRPAVEVADGVVRHNTYANGAKVCYKDSLYECTTGKWEKLRDCPSGIGWEKVHAEKLESGLR